MDTARLLANRYRLETAIGHGGMGVVHRGRDLELERPVAIKLLAADHDGAGLERFLVEAKRTAAVRHPSIVEVFDVGRDGADAFLVMELLEGETLEQRLREQAALSPGDAVTIACQICDALAAAHDAGLVHRDLKPANVFLVRGGDAALRVKLLDFGIAKRIDGATARTDPNMIVGTLEYLAPEQVRGGAVDGRADLYALGTTLYRMLSGELPFKGDNAASLIHQHLSVAPASLLRTPRGASVPPALDALVLRLLAKEPEGRPPTARAARSELVACLGRGGETVAPASGPPSRGERVFDFDDDPAPGAEGFELDLGDDAPRQVAAPRGPMVVPVSGALALPPPSPSPSGALAPVAPVPALVRELARVPQAVSKRVAGYSLFALVLYLVFFSGALLPSLGLVLLAALGGASYAARARLGGDPPV